MIADIVLIDEDVDVLPDFTLFIDDAVTQPWIGLP